MCLMYIDTVECCNRIYLLKNLIQKIVCHFLYVLHINDQMKIGFLIQG